MTPHEFIIEAIMNNAGEMDESKPKDRQLHELADAILQFLDAEGYTLIDSDAVWNFHDSLEAWLNQDVDEHRLSMFSPYDDWLKVFRSLPPRRKYDAAHARHYFKAEDRMLPQRG